MTRSARFPLPRSLLLSLGALATLVLVQQQVLLQRPPRLRELAIQPLRSGAAALDVRFSRPMRQTSIAAGSILTPPLEHRWFGADDAWRLLIEHCLLYTSPSPRDRTRSRMPSSA